jgi:hypothetical protein
MVVLDVPIAKGIVHGALLFSPLDEPDALSQVRLEYVPSGRRDNGENLGQENRYESAVAAGTDAPRRVANGRRL